MKKVLCFCEFFAYVMGAIGGFGYCVMCRQWVIAVAVVVIAVMAFPEFKRAFKELID